MARKIIKITEAQFREFITNMTEVTNGKGRQNHLLVEMAKLNLKDGGKSEFPSNSFRVWVQGENSPNKPPHIHISNTQEGYEIKLLISDASLFGVNNYGNRNRSDTFNDVIKKAIKWYAEPTLMPGRVGTNQETALYEWEACNAD